MSDPIHYRDAVPDDVGFILSSWLKSAGDAWSELKTSDLSQWCDHRTMSGTQVGWFADVPHRFTRTAVAEILERPTTRAIVACDPDDPSVIFGYAIGEPDHRIVHWCHVKHALRRNGIARDLLTRLLPMWRTGLVCTYAARGFLARHLSP